MKRKNKKEKKFNFAVSILKLFTKSKIEKKQKNLLKEISEIRAV